MDDSPAIRALELRTKSLPWAREMASNREFREVDRAQALAVMQELWLFEQPPPLLKVSVKRGPENYTITVVGYTGVIDIKTWCTTFMYEHRAESLKRMTGAWADLTQRDISLVLYLDSADASAVSESAEERRRRQPLPRPPARPEERAEAVAYVDEIMPKLEVLPHDRQWVAATLVEAFLFEQPMPALDVACVANGDVYNITIGGYKNFVDLVSWYNRFLGKGRSKFLCHVTHTWLQNVHEKGPSIVLQMEKGQFQVATGAPAHTPGAGRGGPPRPRPGTRKRYE